MSRAFHILPARPAEGRILSGVCVGIGEAYALDVTLVRFAFLVLALAWGIGILLYGVLWILMPDPAGGVLRGYGARGAIRHKANGVRIDLQQSARYLSRGWQRVSRDPWPRPFGRRWMAVSLIAVGAVFLLTSLGAFSWITPMRATGLVLIVVGLAALLSLRTDRR